MAAKLSTVAASSWFQTPQVFRCEDAEKAYLQDFDTSFTDDASVVEKAGYTVQLTQGNRENIK